MKKGVKNKMLSVLLEEANETLAELPSKKSLKEETKNKGVTEGIIPEKKSKEIIDINNEQNKNVIKKKVIEQDLHIKNFNMAYTDFLSKENDERLKGYKTETAAVYSPLRKRLKQVAEAENITIITLHNNIIALWLNQYIKEAKASIKKSEESLWVDME